MMKQLPLKNGCLEGGNNFLIARKYFHIMTRPFMEMSILTTYTLFYYEIRNAVTFIVLIGSEKNTSF